jgi:hypothetical protein
MMSAKKEWRLANIPALGLNKLNTHLQPAVVRCRRRSNASFKLADS